MLLPDIGDHLVAQGVGTLGTDVFLDAAPDSPDAVTLVQDLTPQAPEYSLTAGAPTLRHYRFQVFTRHATRAGADALAETVFTALSSMTTTGITLNGTRYSGTRCEMPPARYARDDKHRLTLQQVWITTTGG